MVRGQGFPGVTLERVPVREYPGGSTVAPLVGRLGVDANGTVGLEKTLGTDLTGQAGKVRYVRDAAGRPLWIGPGDVTPAVHGADIRLSIDLEIQRIVQEELFRGVNDCESAGGRCVVVDPSTGEVLAMVDLIRAVPDAVDYPFVPVGSHASPGSPEYVPDKRYKVIKEDRARQVHPALGHNRCVESVYEPGSTFKSFVWSTITELGKMHPSDVVNTENGYWITSYGREIKDVKARASETWTEVLINSSNIGMGKGAEKLSFAQLHDAVKRFGFGQKTGIGLPGEATGLVTSLANWKITSQHSVAFGNEVAVTPLQMVRAYSAFARQGEMTGTIPQLKILAGGTEADQGDVVYRVLPARVALLARDAMTHVAESMETSLAASSKEEKTWRYAIFGKSGTSKIPVGKPPAGMRLPHGVRGYIDKQYYSSFLSGGPTESPRLVTLVIIDDPSTTTGVTDWYEHFNATAITLTAVSRASMDAIAAGDFQRRVDRHMEFHRILARMTGNPIMIVVMDAVLVVLDASNLARNLIFAGEVLRRRLPTVVAVNMVDLAGKAGIRVDVEVLSESLGCPAIPICARFTTGSTGRTVSIWGSASRHTRFDGCPTERRSALPTSAARRRICEPGTSHRPSHLRFSQTIRRCRCMSCVIVSRCGKKRCGSRCES